MIKIAYAEFFGEREAQRSTFLNKAGSVNSFMEELKMLQNGYKLDFIRELKMARHRFTWLWKVTAGLVLAVIAAGDFVAECPAICHCQWRAGNKAADCSKAGLEHIPSTLSNEMQVLNLTGNDLIEIPKRAFEIVGLINLKKLILTQCKLSTVHKDGLRSLDIIIELDLSKNDLKTLHSDTFKNTQRIRWIFLNDNKLETLEDGLFRNLPFLQRIELSNNRIHQLGLRTFMTVPNLSILRLDGNKLEYLNVGNFQNLTSLWSLDLHNNLWRCDCHLQPFRDWVVSNNLYTHPISCTEPPKFLNKLWVDLNSVSERSVARSPSINPLSFLKSLSIRYCICTQEVGNTLVDPLELSPAKQLAHEAVRQNPSYKRFAQETQRQSGRLRLWVLSVPNPICLYPTNAMLLV
ncbi:Leucine-rich repeat-containing protein 26 [Eumeta japonica]|uniref:Leucine-rich repeat-containing protein 26 n=1 Tax=Eumeta variegata TaxID=151549 RepID=A0A4C1U0C0_EUMVA|nr:Leucine-rich repeat-containing protein 26 [Eumeta japonica]